jgi:hypothetical protein
MKNNLTHATIKILQHSPNVQKLLAWIFFIKNLFLMLNPTLNVKLLNNNTSLNHITNNFILL